MPICPKHLDDEAKREWRRAGKVLKSVGLMTELDRATLAAYCDAYSRWVQATLKVQELGAVYVKGGVYDKKTNKTIGGEPRLNPYVRIAREAFDQMIRTGTLIGMSPSSRASLKVEKPKKKDPAEAEKERLFK
jgi:P27 family predicted phage terminase small subunit